jgi:hypothetical protein
MPKLQGIKHLDAIRAFEKAGFWIARQSKHIILTNGERILSIPRANPINEYTLGTLIKDSGLSVEEFRKLL